MGKRLWLFLAICLMTVGLAFAQSSKITGKVIDKSTGEPVIGAAVVVKGTSVGSATDLNGNFTINGVPANAKVLSVSYVGMIPVEVAVKNGIRILMEPDTKSLDEVMVVAYGTQKKSTFTGSAAVVKAEDIENHVSSSVVGALQGSAPGVQITSTNGDPTGASQSIRIRGIGSLSASAAPLIVLDGVPFDGSLNSINPQDVESMTVLKDAAASAIYGARGANGVVLITTKKGKKQDAEIHFDAKWGINSRLIPQYDIIKDPGQYYEMAYRQLYNSQVYAGYSATEAYTYADKNLFDQNNGGLGYQVYTVPEGQKLIGQNFKLNPNAKLGYSDGEYYYTPDDWYDNVYHNSFRQEYNFSVSGATDRINYYASVGYLNDKGNVDNSGFQRYTARTNVDYQVKKWLKVGASMSFTHTDSNRPSYSANSSWASSGSLFYLANNMGPIYPLYVRNPDGSIKHDDNGLTVYDSNNTNQVRPNFVGNAVRDNSVNFRKTYGDLFSGNWSAIFTPVKGLTLTARIGAEAYNTRANNLYSRFGSSSAVDGLAEVYHTRNFSINNQYLANYQTDFGSDDVHHFEILAGYEQYKHKYQYLDAYNDHLFIPTVGELTNAAGTDNKQMESLTADYMTEGFLSRAQYDYMEKYFVSASFRRDASSHFAKGHRWGSFFSFGAAWNIAKEDFMKDITWVDLLKLKVSYGEQGNDNLDNVNFANEYYPYADMYDVTYNSETKEYSTVLVQKGNENLTWEKNKNFNIGVDFGLFKGRLSGTFEFFTRNTSDLLYLKDTPLSAGIITGWYPVNVGSVRNTGIELTLNATAVRTKDFSWDINFNMTHYKNKITSLDPSVSETGIKGGTSILRVGGSAYEAYLYKYAGVYTENNFCGETYNPALAGKAMYYYDVKDKETGKVIGQDRTTVFSDATQYDCGDVLPKLEGGLGMSFKYKNFDLGMQFQYQLGGKIYDAQYQALMHTSEQSIGSAWHKDALNFWSAENPNSNIPRLDTDYSVSQSAVDRFQTSSDFFAINNVTLGYTFPKVIMSRAGIESLRIYVAAENLAIATARKGLDPRFNFGIGGYTSGTGYSSGNYGTMRTITAGITLSF